MNPLALLLPTPPGTLHATALPLAAALVLAALPLPLHAASGGGWQPLPKHQRSTLPDPTPAKGATLLARGPESAPDSPATPAAEPRPVQVVVNAVAVTDDTPPPSAEATPVVVAAPVAEPAAVAVDGKKLYSFRATDLDIKAALAMFARANELNIVPDRDVTGPVTVDLRDLPLHKVMQALLESYDYFWEDADGLIRVRATDTQEYWIDYLRLSRKGIGSSSATLASGMTGGSGGGGGGAAQGGSSINLTADNNIDFWVELREEISRLLSPAGRESIAVNMTAGILQITDRPSHLKRVRRYLESLSGSVARQVEIRARIFDVTLRDQFQFGINWEHAAKAFGGVATMGGSTIVTAPIGGVPVRDSAFSFLFQGDDTTVLLEALEEQGEVNVVSQPRIRVVNNQTAMIKVGTEQPFFTSRTTYLPGAAAGTTTQLQEDSVNTITVGTILAITPQISSNLWITLDIAPVLTSLVETRVSPSEATTAPVLDIKQASTLVRVRDGDTVIIGGLMQDERGTTIRKIPWIGDIPILGHLFRGKLDYKAKKELVISITPTVVF